MAHHCVFCHHSLDVSLAFRQRFITFKWWRLLMMWHPSANHSKSSLPSSSSLHSSFTSGCYLLPSEPSQPLYWNVLAMCTGTGVGSKIQDCNICIQKSGIVATHSPRWISLTFRQGPLHFNGDLSLYIAALPSMDQQQIITSIVIILLFILYFWPCFHPSWATLWATSSDHSP